MTRCETCSNEAVTTCAACNRAICTEHTLTIRFGRPGDTLELEVCGLACERAAAQVITSGHRVN